MTLDAIAFEVRDLADLMDVGRLRMDGGAAADDLLHQLRADLIGVPVERPLALQSTALGATFLAELGGGVWSSPDELRQTWALDRRFDPAGARDAAEAARQRWRPAVERSEGWAAED